MNIFKRKQKTKTPNYKHMLQFEFVTIKRHLAANTLYLNELNEVYEQHKEVLKILEPKLKTANEMASYYQTSLKEIEDKLNSIN